MYHEALHGLSATAELLVFDSTVTGKRLQIVMKLQNRRARTSFHPLKLASRHDTALGYGARFATLKVR